MFARLFSFFLSFYLQHVRPILTHRMAGWLFASLILMVTLALSFGQLRAVFGFKTLLIIWGTYLGYWAARGVLRDYRPDNYLTTPFSPGAPATGMPLPVANNMAIAFAAAVLARAIIVAAVVVAVALGA